jgi:hypothetical protein
MNHVILYVTINFVTYTGHTMKSCGQNVGENYGLTTWIAWGKNQIAGLLILTIQRASL